MKLKHMKLRKCLFTDLKGLCKKEKQEYLQECSDEIIHVICEACFNLLKHEKINKKKDVQRRIHSMESHFKKLTVKKHSVKLKRRILEEVGVEVISLIAKYIIPLLTTLIEE